MCAGRKRSIVAEMVWWLKRRPDMDEVGPPEWKGEGREGGST